MTSREYLQALGDALSTLVPDRERSEIIRYYEEYFEEAGPEREAELIGELGDPGELARKIAREGGFSGGEGKHASTHPNRWKWVAGIAAAAVLVLAGTFAARRSTPSFGPRPMSPAARCLIPRRWACHLMRLPAPPRRRRASPSGRASSPARPPATRRQLRTLSGWTSRSPWAT